MSRHRLAGPHRRGMSIIVVLCLIAVTLGATYALMRVEHIGVKIQHNTNRKSLARQAALVGVSVAMRRMHEAGWTGVGTTISGSISPQDSYQVTYTAGDDSLSSTSPNFAEYPYRVTLNATGTSIDTTTPGLRGTHRIRVVVRLVPRKLADGPPELADMSSYPIYQTHNNNFELQIPIRIDGPTRIKGTVSWGSYPWSSAIRDRYIDDLDLMRLAGQSDRRPFEGPLHIAYSANNSSIRNYLTSTVGVALIDTPASSMSSQWTHPGSISTYKVYPGGRTYSVGSIPSNITSSTPLAADPMTNPAGIFYRSGSFDVEAGANVQGTLICSNQMDFKSGTSTLAPAPLPSIHGSNATPRLPAAIVATLLEIEAPASPTVDGLLAVFGDFSLPRRAQSLPVTVRGCVAARAYEMSGGRDEFNVSATFWLPRYSAFIAQLGAAIGIRIDFFPQYLDTVGVSSWPKSTPQVRFLKPTTPIQYVWPSEGGSIFVAHPSDGGLRWELISWRENQ